MRVFPAPWCELCGVSAPCRAANRVRPDYPACQRMPRHVPEATVRGLVAAWAAPPEAARALELAVAHHLAGEGWSDHFEPSVSWDPAGEHVARFSLSLPSFRKSPGSAAAFAESFARAFDDATGDAFRDLLAQVHRPCVEQLLVGAAWDAGGARAKLYVQFRADDPRGAAALAATLTGRPIEGSEWPLHLLGLDVAQGAVREGKRYHLAPRVPLSSSPWPVPLLDDLRARGVTELRNVLAIHRSRSDATEIDFALPENELRWSDLAELPSVRAAQAGRTAFDALRARFPVAVRRVSAPIGRSDKLNVYYFLTATPR